MTNIILCGGNGTRLWPISRALMPKQFVKLFDDKSLFQLTVQRNTSTYKQQFIISNVEQYFLSLDQLQELDIATNKFLLEPVGRNTAPAIALACLALPEDEVVLVSPSDHLIKDTAAYEQALARAKALALQDTLVTFGIQPTFAETGFGYIESEGENVKAFHEKPDKKTAQSYVDAGNFYWNSGMFCFKAGIFLQELKKHAPNIYKTAVTAFANKIITHNNDSEIIRIQQETMRNIPEESIDYAVMEKSDKVKVVAADIGWSDLGSFDALSEEFETDANGNTLNENLIAIHSKNNFVYPSERLISLVDINDLIVVDTPDALLVSKKGNSQKIKSIVKELKGRESDLHNIHQTAHRPWGTYTVLEDNPGYKIKRIVVKPGKRLSLQKHFHRSEHWIVVSGTATVTIGENVTTLRANESTYIKMGELHRLENEGKIDVVLIEAQVGDYTGEDDIVRIEDDYKRI
ncbi:mannose-1-phosphate guanylyltransferase/mannose-6-phosphate isomerase [Sulfurimonas sp.]